MRKVLMVAPLPPPYGGISHWTSEVVQRSKRRKKVSISVVDSAVRYRDVTDLSVPGRVLKGARHAFGVISQVLRLLFSGRYSVFHIATSGSYGFIRDIILLCIGRLFGVSNILHFHFGRIPDLLARKGWENTALRMVMRLANHVIAIDKQTENAIRGNVPNVSVFRVPNFIDFSTIEPTAIQRQKVILFVGWVLASKGVEELLEAWSLVARPDWKVKFVGPYSNDYVDGLISRFSCENVEFAGKYEHSSVLGEMATAQIFCLPSHTEGFPNVVLEAMASKCAVIASSVGAIPEIITKGTGVLVPKKNTTVLARELSALMDDPSACKSMGECASERVRCEYSIDSVYRQYEKIWEGDLGD